MTEKRDRGGSFVLRLCGAVCCVAASSCSALPRGVTDQSQRLHGDWVIFFYCGIGVAVIVYALILYPLARWRRPPNAAYPAQADRNVPLELTYTVIPLLIVAGLFAVTYANETSVEALSKQPAVSVDVTAFDWSWRFRYPQLGIDIAGTPQNPPELVLPLGQTTRIRLTSADVNHAFWVPAFLFKRDAIPGVLNEFDVTPNTVGSYLGECAEFCGLEHADMRFTVRVVAGADFARWVREHRP